MNSRKIIILPIMYRNCEVPALLADRKYADFRTNYEQGFVDLCSALGLKRTKSITESNWRLFIKDKKVDWKHYREIEFKELVTRLVDRAKQYNWSSWTGGTKNPLSITLSAFIDQNKRKYISIRMVGGAYMAADCNEANPNNNTELSRYTIYVGNTVNECEEYVWRHMKDFHMEYGDPTDISHHATRRFLSLEQKWALAHNLLKNTDWYQGDTF